MKIRAYFRHVFATNFFLYIFSKLFQRIRNQREILRFYIPMLNFLIKISLMLFLALFVNFDCTCAGNGSKKENLILWMCLRILLGNHQRVCITKLLKLFYSVPTVQPQKRKSPKALYQYFIMYMYLYIIQICVNRLNL